MFQRLLLLAVALWMGVAATKTIQVPENENVVVAVPTRDTSAGQEPMMRVVARDLDSVNVLPYVPDDAMARARNRGGGGHQGEGMAEDEDGYGSDETNSRNSPQKYSRHDSSRRRRQESYQGEGGLEMLNVPKTTIIGPQGVAATVPGLVAEGVSSQPQTGMPGKCASRIRRRNYSEGPPRMSRGACRQALSRVGYCKAVLRRVQMCEENDTSQKRHGNSVRKKQQCRRSTNKEARRHSPGDRRRSDHSPRRSVHHYSRQDRHDSRHPTNARQIHQQ